MDGVMAAAHVSIFPPQIEINRLKLIETPGGQWNEPLFYAERIDLSLLWGSLFEGDAVLNARITKPKVIVYQKARKKTEKGLDLASSLEEQAPLKLARIEVVDGELVLSSGEGKNLPLIWLHDVQIVVQNLTSRKDLGRGRPATAMMRGRLQKSARVEAFATLDPWNKGLNFSGRASVKGLGPADVNGILANEAEMVLKKGSVDIFTEFDVRRGKIKGGVKPVLKNIELAASDNGLWNRLKAWMADTTLDVLSDDLPGRDAVATVIPIKGRIDDPKVQLTPTLIGIVRNAFVIGLRSGFTHLPPPGSRKEDSVIKQVKEGLDRKEGKPEAQPAHGKEG